jgi:short-subunit dehydrogenase
VSLASYFGLPYSGGYGPSKAALASLAESLQPELEAHGIQLQWINHGFVKSRLTDLNPFDMPQLMEADEAAAQILKGMASDSPEVHFPWRLAKGLRFLRLLPIGLALKLTRRLVK